MIANEQYQMKRYIAARVMTINGKPSPCECNERIICAYCVQANLIVMDRLLKKGSDVVKGAIDVIKANGIRKTARQIGEYENTIRRWIKTGNVPAGAVEKIAKLRTQP